MLRHHSRVSRVFDDAPGECDGGEDADTGRQREHQSDHDSREVDRAHGVQDDENPLVVDILDAVPETGGKDAGQDVEIEEEGEPGGGLMLGDGRDDRDVDLGVSRVPKGVETESRQKE